MEVMNEGVAQDKVRAVYPGSRFMGPTRDGPSDQPWLRTPAHFSFPSACGDNYH
jgi:hypothetical protein